MMLLAGDIGGTKTDLAVYSHESGPHSRLVQAEVHSADYPSLQVLVTEFLKKVRMPVERACFDVAGPRAIEQDHPDFHRCGRFPG